MSERTKRDLPDIDRWVSFDCDEPEADRTVFYDNSESGMQVIRPAGGRVLTWKPIARSWRPGNLDDQRGSDEAVSRLARSKLLLTVAREPSDGVERFRCQW